MFYFSCHHLFHIVVQIHWKCNKVYLYKESALQPLDLPLISTTETLENDDIFLSCTADVGKSPGYVKWWRFRADKSISLISQSETLSDEAGTCIFITTANTTYQVTREDIGAFFRCTSHNNITQDQGPEENPHYRDTEKINVFCEYYWFVGPEMMLLSEIVLLRICYIL